MLGVLKHSHKNLIVLYWYYFIPSLSFLLPGSLGVYPKLVYDILLVVVFLCSVIYAVFNGRVVKVKSAFYLLVIVGVFALFFLIKQVNLFAVESWRAEQYSGTLVREIKPIFYFSVAAVYLLSFGPPNKECFVYGGAFFSCLVILDALLKYVLYGEPLRPYIIDEANYDNFLVLISLISLFVVRPRKFYFYFLLFLVATLVSQSKTGMVSFFALSFVYFVFHEPKYNRKILFSFVLVLSIPLVINIFQYRLQSTGDILQADRFRMISVFLDYLSSADLLALFFGQVPGGEILSYDSRLEWFIRSQTEAIGAYGLHPFNLHGFHMRFISSWGWGLFIIVVLWVVMSVKKSISAKYILILFFLQGFSLGVFYLSVVSVIFLIFIVSADNNCNLPLLKCK